MIKVGDLVRVNGDDESIEGEVVAVLSKEIISILMSNGRVTRVNLISVTIKLLPILIGRLFSPRAIAKRKRRRNSRRERRKRRREQRRKDRG